MMEPVPDKLQSFAYSIIYWASWIIELLLFLRFLFLLLGANPLNRIVAFIYAASSTLMAPFANIFTPWSDGRFTFDPSILVAMVVYAVIAYALTAFLGVMNRSRYHRVG